MHRRAAIATLVVLALTVPGPVSANAASAQTPERLGWRLGFYVDTGKGPKLIGHGVTVGSKDRLLTDGLIGGDPPVAEVATSFGQSGIGIAAADALPTWVDVTDPGRLPPGAELVAPPKRGQKRPVRVQKLDGRRLEVHVRPSLGAVSPNGLALRRIEEWRDHGGTIRRIVDDVTFEDADGEAIRILAIADRAKVVAPAPPILGSMVPGAAAIHQSGAATAAAARAPVSLAHGGRFSRPAGPPGGGHCHSEWTRTGSRLVCDDGTAVEVSNELPLRVTPPPEPADPVAQRRERVLIPRLVLSSGFCAGMIVILAGLLAGGVTIGLGLAVGALYVLACGLLAHDVDALSHGEPHLVSLDGHDFDLQAIGEFVFLDSPTFEVQTRYTGDKGVATSAEATAVRSGEHVIESYFSDAADASTRGVPIVLDGEATRIATNGLTLDDGTFVARRTGSSSDRGVLVVSPGGSYALVENLSLSQNVIIGLAPTDSGTVTGGVAGIPDGNESNDFVLRDGTSLDPATAETIEGLYGRFAGAWRVRPEERLFTHGTAEEFLTDEYTSVPEELGSLSDVPADTVRKARDACRAARVTDGRALEACAYDVATTDDQRWARQAGASATARQAPSLRQQPGPHPEEQRGAAPRPGKPFTLATSEHLAAPAVAADRNGLVHAAWVEGLTLDAKIVERSLDRRGRWSKPRALAKGAVGVSAPELVTDADGDVCAFWNASEPEGLHLQCFERGRWSRPKQVEDRGLTAEYAPGFTADGTEASVYSIPPNYIGFGEIQLNAGTTASWPAFTVDASGRLHALWGQFAGEADPLGGTVHRVSEDGGSTWSTTELVDELATDHDVVADADGNVHLIAQSGEYHRWSAGTGWGDEIDVSGDLGAGGGRLALMDASRVLAFFPTRDGVYVAAQRADGTFGSPRRVAARGNVVDGAALVVDDRGTRHLVWVTSEGQDRVVYTRV